MLKHNRLATAILLTLCATPISYADSTVVYESSNKAGDKVEHTILISGPWLRIDSVPKGKTDYSIMDTSRLLKFDIDEKEKTYQLTRMGRLYWPETPLISPNFKLLRKKNTVAGVACQPVNELGENKQAVAEHCMAAGSSLRLSAREMFTLTRLFMSSRRMSDKLSDSLLGVATPDERQASILSQDPAGNKLELKSVSHGWINKKLMKIPTGYKKLKPELPVNPDVPKNTLPPIQRKTTLPGENNKK
ncbi:MAG: hypothetical protein DRQ44_08135 [Gammaproteobacteria bacterium]|nr:MAG: hypothetical protein DRQ44_08135 [Gammaproteobacteria bacterium]